MIRATDRTWNSATTLYIARRLEQIANGRHIRVLDMGCGDGTVMEHLSEYGYELYGYDLGHREEVLGAKRGIIQDGLARGRIHVTSDERKIPFDDDFFDVVYANQVFEHVKFLDCMLGECARVLNSSGILLINFPLATYPVELHLKIPFAHWIPPGKSRVRFLTVCHALGLGRRGNGESAREAAVRGDAYLRDKTYYRFINEIMGVSHHYFGSCELETGEFVRAKIDLLKNGRSVLRRLLGRLVGYLDGGLVSGVVTYCVNAAFCMQRPRKPDVDRAVVMMRVGSDQKS
jgi:SAM-dependent methyltransferase